MIFFVRVTSFSVSDEFRTVSLEWDLSEQLDNSEIERVSFQIGEEKLRMLLRVYGVKKIGGISNVYSSCGCVSVFKFVVADDGGSGVIDLHLDLKSRSVGRSLIVVDGENGERRSLRLELHKRGVARYLSGQNSSVEWGKGEVRFPVRVPGEVLREEGIRVRTGEFKLLKAALQGVKVIRTSEEFTDLLLTVEVEALAERKAVSPAFYILIDGRELPIYGNYQIIFRPDSFERQLVHNLKNSDEGIPLSLSFPEILGVVDFVKVAEAEIPFTVETSNGISMIKFSFKPGDVIVNELWIKGNVGFASGKETGFSFLLNKFESIEDR